MEALTKLECLRCGGSWFPRSPATPKNCPKCTTPLWNKPRVRDWKPGTGSKRAAARQKRGDRRAETEAKLAAIMSYAKEGYPVRVLRLVGSAIYHPLPHSGHTYGFKDLIEAWIRRDPSDTIPRVYREMEYHGSDSLVYGDICLARHEVTLTGAPCVLLPPMSTASAQVARHLSQICAGLPKTAAVFTTPHPERTPEQGDIDAIANQIATRKREAMQSAPTTVPWKLGYLMASEANCQAMAMAFGLKYLPDLVEGWDYFRLSFLYRGSHRNNG